MTDVKKVEAWIQKMLLTSTVEAPLVRLTLRHIRQGASSDRGTKVVELTVEVKSEAKELAEDAYLAAEMDAAPFEGRQTYQLLAFHGENEDHTARCNFAVAPDNRDDDFAGPSEPGDSRGLVSQAMRHQEQNQRVLVQAMGETVRALAGQIERQDAMISRFQERELEFLERREKFTEALVVAEIRQGDQKQAALAALLQAAPLILAKLLGADPSEELASAAGQMFSGIPQKLKDRPKGEDAEEKNSDDNGEEKKTRGG